jgi:hypothetical protein
MSCELRTWDLLTLARGIMDNDHGLVADLGIVLAADVNDEEGESRRVDGGVADVAN